MNKLLFIAVVAVLSLAMLGVICFLIWFPISPLNTVFNLMYQKEVSGVVYDCETTRPVADATVTMVGTGWAWEDGPIWDKGYLSRTESAGDGSFDLKYNLGTELTAEKDGYIKATKYTSTQDELKVGMIKKTSANEDELSSYDCKIFSECFKTKMIEGVETSWDSCSNPELNQRYGE